MVLSGTVTSSTNAKLLVQVVLKAGVGVAVGTRVGVAVGTGVEVEVGVAVGTFVAVGVVFGKTSTTMVARLPA